VKIIGIFILALELIALALQLKSECSKNGLTAAKLKAKFFNFRSQLPFAPKPKPRPKLWHKFSKSKSKPSFLYRRKSK